VSGRLVDMADVLFSADRAARVGSSRAEFFNAVNPAAPIVSITATDESTLAVKLKEPVYYVLGMLANNVGGRLNIVPKETDTTFDIRRDIIGTGPFVLSSYAPSGAFSFQRNADFYDRSAGPYADRLEMPILPEYSTALAALKSGQIHTYDFVRGEDALTLKRETPDLDLYQADIFPLVSLPIVSTAFGWLPEGRSPFLDERVRQAYSLSLDRDLWLDAVYNVAAFRDQGLPVDTKLSSSVRVDYDGWLDPRGREFGPNMKYYQPDIAEARKLLAAAGYTGGLDLVSTVPSGTPYGVDYGRQLAITEGMAREAGFRTTVRQVDFTSEFIPRYRSSRGRFEGWTHRGSGGFGYDAVTRMRAEYYSRSGDAFYGFSSAGRSDGAGDPYVDAQIEKAVTELDGDRRRELAADLQRYLARTQYDVKWPGGATGFKLAWPALRNFNVFRMSAAGGRPEPSFWWLDETRPPLKRP
jgi:ABC-type transport system substrate-binding protein